MPAADVAQKARPELAAITVWAEDVDATAAFYRDVVGLTDAPTHSNDPIVLDAGAALVVIMEGQLAPPIQPKRRWPMLALQVRDLNESLSRLRAAGVALPWGIEEYGAPDPTSRYVMFYDPAGNLIELVQFLR